MLQRGLQCPFSLHTSISSAEKLPYHEHYSGDYCSQAVENVSAATSLLYSGDAPPGRDTSLFAQELGALPRPSYSNQPSCAAPASCKHCFSHLSHTPKKKKPKKPTHQFLQLLIKGVFYNSVLKKKHCIFTTHLDLVLQNPQFAFRNKRSLWWGGRERGRREMELQRDFPSSFPRTGEEGDTPVKLPPSKHPAGMRVSHGNTLPHQKEKKKKILKKKFTHQLYPVMLSCAEAIGTRHPRLPQDALGRPQERAGLVACSPATAGTGKEQLCQPS